MLLKPFNIKSKKLNQNNKTPLYYAREKNSKEILEILLSKEGPLQKRPLTLKELSYLSLIYPSNHDQDKPEILPIINSKNTFTDAQPLLMNVPSNFAIPFLQLFSNLPETLLLSSSLNISSLNLTVNIPSPITISVSQFEDKFQFGFFPTNSASSNDVQTVINIALNSIAWGNWRKYDIKNVENKAFAQTDLLEIAKKYNTVVQVLESKMNFYINSLSIQFRVLLIGIQGTYKTNQLDRDIHNMFEKVKTEGLSQFAQPENEPLFDQNSPNN